jgi:hypothetical protein
VSGTGEIPERKIRNNIVNEIFLQNPERFLASF